MVQYSLDGGKTWKANLRGDPWPTEEGGTVLHYVIPGNERSKSIMVKVTGSDQKREGVRKILAFGEPYSQLSPLP